MMKKHQAITTLTQIPCSSFNGRDKGCPGCGPPMALCRALARTAGNCQQPAVRRTCPRKSTFMYTCVSDQVHTRYVHVYMYICMYSTLHVHATQRQHTLRYNSSNNVRFRNSETLMCCPLFVRKVCWCRPTTASSTRRVIV